MMLANLSKARCPPGLACCQRRTAKHIQNFKKIIPRSFRYVDLPIFTVSGVAFPNSTVPLTILEPRYRVLFSTLLSGEPGVDEDLVQKDSPLCGTKQFGMCHLDEEGEPATVGTILKVSEFISMPNGRIIVTSRGHERFRVEKIVKEKPVLFCHVKILEDDEDANSAPAHELSKRVADLMRLTIKFNVRMSSIRATEDQIEPEELAEDLAPQALSFYVASFMGGISGTQQELLETRSTVERLWMEERLLSQTVKFFGAASALKHMGPSGSG